VRDAHARVQNQLLSEQWNMCILWREMRMTRVHNQLLVEQRNMRILWRDAHARVQNQLLGEQRNMCILWREMHMRGYKISCYLNKGTCAFYGERCACADTKSAVS
jgi:hypothetical protein